VLLQTETSAIAKLVTE